MTIRLDYVPGTGNSLHAARELRRRLPEARLIPIVGSLRRSAIQTGADAVGFVFPNFCLTIPIALRDFLDKADLASARYLFALCTRGGSHSEAFDYLDELLAKQGKKLNARVNVNMPWNHMIDQNLPATTNDEAVIRRLEAGLQSALDGFAKSILAREAYGRGRIRKPGASCRSG
ncbi:MAG: EFR1 family ferrodoxin [Anaerolineales bacterium]|nr:EFR1 family ferrodoxin [Anaerolineales bacterium]